MTFIHLCGLNVSRYLRVTVSHATCAVSDIHLLIVVGFHALYRIDLPPTHKPPPPYTERPPAIPLASQAPQVASFSQVNLTLLCLLCGGPGSTVWFIFLLWYFIMELHLKDDHWYVPYYLRSDYMLSCSWLFPEYFFLFLSFLAFSPIQHITLLKNTPASGGLLV